MAPKKNWIKNNFMPVAS